MHPVAVAVAVLTVLPSGGPAGFKREAQGEWVAAAAEWAGKPVPAEVAQRIKVTVGPASVTVSPLIHEDGKFDTRGEPIEFRYRLDPAAKPKAIDLTLKGDGGTEQTQLGIYALDGGQFKLCWQHDGRGRPMAFKTVEEPAQLLLVLVRPKK
jgi:uncharacterized protein (TIGR03067 family)